MYTPHGMATNPTASTHERLLIGFHLDRLWHDTMGDSAGDTKHVPLRLLAEILERARVPYALIGGLAVQVRTVEPRTTLDIDIAVRHYTDVPREVLLKAGFEHTGRHPHSDTWRAPGVGPLAARTAVQFSADDEGIADAIARATDFELDGVRLRVAASADLILLKLAAAEEPTRRPSKRHHDVADVMALLEAEPAAGSPGVLARLREAQRRLFDTQPRSPGEPRPG